MTIDGFLTFLSLMLAAYALTSPTTRMRLSLLWGWPLFVGAIAFTSILYLQFFDLVGQPCSTRLGIACQVLRFETYGLDPSRLSFLVVLSSIVAMWALLRRQKVSPGGLPALSNLLTQLISEGRYSEAVNLLQPNLMSVRKAMSGDLFWPRLHARIRAIHPGLSPPWALTDDLAANKPIRWQITRSLALARHLVPAGRKAESASTNIYAAAASSPGFIKHLTAQRLDMAITFLKFKSWRSSDYAERFLIGLFEDEASPLYREKGETLPPNGEGHAYGDAMPLHAGLFNEADEAKALGIWKPVGDYIIRRLTHGGDRDYIAYLNSPPIEIDRDMRTDPLDAAIEFFDVMVRAAAFQRVRDHMWLFYFSFILRELLGRYDTSAPGVNLGDEWAIRADYSIYRLFCVLIGWAVLPMRLPEASPHLHTAHADLRPDGQNIPKSAILCLGDSFAQLLESAKVRPGLKSYIAQMVFREMRDLERSDFSDPFYAILKQSIIERGGLGSNQEYGQNLRTAFADIDHVISSDLGDFEAAMSTEYPAPRV